MFENFKKELKKIFYDLLSFIVIASIVIGMYLLFISRNIITTIISALRMF